VKSEGHTCNVCNRELVICGQNGILDADLVGCGQIIWETHEVYRCTDCCVPFHRHCAKKHFESGNVLTPEVYAEQERRWNEREAAQREESRP